jgi:hypothetical protein
MNAEQYRALVNKLERIQQIGEAEAPTTPVVGDIKQTPVVGTPLPAPAAGPVKSQANYNMALQQIQSLYAKAQVAYPPQDDIVRTRFGLPPALPPFEQWDGKMPQAGEADFLTRNVFGRQASKDITQQNKNNTIQATSGAQVDQNNIANVAKLKDLVAKLSATSAPKAAAPAATEPAPAGTMSAESSDLRSALAKMLKEDFNIDMAEAGEDKQALIKQIQDLMAQINSDNENPEPEVAQALQDAQTAIDTASAAQTEKEKEIGANQDQEDADMGAAMTANAQVATQTANGIDAQGNNVTMPNGINPETGTPTTPQTQAGQAAPANQTFGQAFKAARASGAKEFDYKGKKYSTAQKGENPALDAAMAGKKPTAPTPPTAPAAPTPPAQSGQTPPAGQTPSVVKKAPAAGSFSADMDARKKATQPAWMKQNENVGYNEDQTLARIINLANIR